MRPAFFVSVTAAVFFLASDAQAQYRIQPDGVRDSAAVSAVRTEATADSTLHLTLDDALRIALSENITVQVADKEIERTGYAKKG